MFAGTESGRCNRTSVFAYPMNIHGGQTDKYDTDPLR
jgi:hypothetical protein